MDKMRTLELLNTLGACRDALRWARDHPDPREAYKQCPNAGWLRWLFIQMQIYNDDPLLLWPKMWRATTASALRRLVSFKKLRTAVLKLHPYLEGRL